MRSTKSNSLVPSVAATSSRISAVMRSISAKRERIARGVKRRIATRRSGPCRGGSSVTTISVGWPGTDSEPSGPTGMTMSPCSFEKRSGCEATHWMSPCFVIAQNGS